MVIVVVFSALQVTSSTDVPIATGERMFSIDQFRDLFEQVL